MEKKKMELLVTGGLIVLFLFLLISTLTKRTKKVSTKEIPQEEPIAEVKKTKTAKPVKVRDLKWGRDPFVLAPRKAKDRKGHFVLTAVIWDEAEPHAVINNEIVIVGQEIEGYCIIKITKDTAILKKGDKELTIELYK